MGEKIALTEFVLYDLNRTVNEEIGRDIVDLKPLRSYEDNQILISYKNVGVPHTLIPDKG